MARLSKGIAASECPACGWRQASAEFLENEEGLVVAVTFECDCCGHLDLTWFD